MAANVGRPVIEYDVADHSAMCTASHRLAEAAEIEAAAARQTAVGRVPAELTALKATACAEVAAAETMACQLDLGHRGARGNKLHGTAYSLPKRGQSRGRGGHRGEVSCSESCCHGADHLQDHRTRQGSKGGNFLLIHWIMFVVTQWRTTHAFFFSFPFLSYFIPPITVFPCPHWFVSDIIQLGQIVAAYLVEFFIHPSLCC